ncbi:TPA: hypothetical protein I7235_01490 [Vibrio vulnificus]|jgi:hypothetical protein|nr:hypothetical protein [Vibrio vulnificus]HDY7590593.1 hypothetical protein [Vibrio vulnificus]HDY7702250.1 hypothetical protein [Vibrio vulnificus]
MKYFFLVLTLIFSQFANAGNGKALIPHWESVNSVLFFVSNITSNPIEVNMKLYDEKGNVVNLEEVGLSSQFILEPKASKKLLSDGKNLKWKFGFGSISWKNLGADENEVAIMAVAETWGGNGGKIVLNNGQPF